MGTNEENTQNILSAPNGVHCHLQQVGAVLAAWVGLILQSCLGEGHARTVGLTQGSDVRGDQGRYSWQTAAAAELLYRISGFLPKPASFSVDNLNSLCFSSCG